MKRIFCTIGFLGALTAALAQEKQYADKIVAIVGTNVVLLSDVGKQYMGAQREFQTSLPEEAKCAMLRDAIVAKILVQQADRDSIVVDPERVESQLDYRISSLLYSGFNGNKAAMEAEMGKSIYQIKEEYRSVVRDNLTYMNMYEEIVKDVTITPKEVETYFNQLPEERRVNVPASVEVGEIVIKPDVNPEVEAYTKQRMEEIRRQVVEEGKSFATMAQIYSEDAGANNGGELSLNRREGRFDSRFVAAAFRLQPGEVSPVFRSSFGYHIVQMLERNGDDAKIRYIVLIPKQTSSDFEQALTQLDSVRNELIASKLSFNDAVNKVSNDENSKQMGGMIRDQRTGSTILNIEALRDAELAMQVADLNVGEYSKPHVYVDETDGTTKARILYVKSKLPPHQLNLKDDYSQIQQEALEVKKTNYLYSWLQEKKKEYYIKIDPAFLSSCEELAAYATGN